MAHITQHIFGGTSAELPRRTVAITVAGVLDESAVQKICASLTEIDARRSAAIVSLDGLLAIHWSAMCRLCALVRTLQPKLDLRLRAQQPRVRRLLEALSAA